MQKFLPGIEYPADKQKLIRTARDNQAPEEVLSTIQKMPGDRFGGPQDLMKAYGQAQ